MDRLRFSTLSRPISVGDSKTSTAAAGGTRTSGDGDGGTAARWGGGNRAAGDWVFSELSDQLERAEDGLLAGAQCHRLKNCAPLIAALSLLYNYTGIGAVCFMLPLEGHIPLPPPPPTHL